MNRRRWPWLVVAFVAGWLIGGVSWIGGIALLLAHDFRHESGVRLPPSTSKGKPYDHRNVAHHLSDRARRPRYRTSRLNRAAHLI